MKNLKKTDKKIARKFTEFMKKDKSYSIVSKLSLLVIILSILSLTYIIDNAGNFTSVILFSFVILNLYVLALAGSLWIFSKFKSIGLIRATFLKITALTVSVIGLLIIFQTLGNKQELQMMEIFFLLIGTAIPLTIGKMIWDLTKNIENGYVIKKIDKNDNKKESSRDTFSKMQEYKEEMIDEDINAKGDE